MTDNELLQQILAKINAMDTKINSMETDIRETKTELRETKTELRETKTELRETRVLVESMPHQIKLIAEQHGVIIEKLDALSDYPVTRERVATLEGGLKMVADRVKTLEAV